MNKLLKIIKLSLIIFTLNGCAYEPIFFKKTYNFKIEEIKLSGDKTVNSILTSKLKFIKNSDANINNAKKYFINLNTEKERKVISKDSKGDPSKFEISILTNYKISDDQKLLISREIKQTNIYNNNSDKFKLEQSEKIIIDNLSEKIAETIISSIINLNDN